MPSPVFLVALLFGAVLADRLGPVWWRGSVTINAKSDSASSCSLSGFSPTPGEHSACTEASPGACAKPCAVASR